MKHYVKHIFCLSVIVLVIMVGACKKNSSDFRDTMIGTYAGVDHYVSSGPPPGMDQDVIGGPDTILVSKDMSGSGFIVNNTEAFAQILAQDSSHIEYIDNNSGTPRPAFLDLSRVSKNVVYHYNDWSGVSHTNYNYFVGSRIN